MKVQPNDPGRAGQLASRRFLFSTSRYAVAAVHTRFQAVQFFVWDADRLDEFTGNPSVIRQADTLEQALAGLQGAEELFQQMKERERADDREYHLTQRQRAQLHALDLRPGSALFVVGTLAESMVNTPLDGIYYRFPTIAVRDAFEALVIDTLRGPVRPW